MKVLVFYDGGDDLEWMVCQRSEIKKAKKKFKAVAIRRLAIILLFAVINLLFFLKAETNKLDFF